MRAANILCAAMIALLILVVVVAATGGTFGQRCGRLHPTDHAAFERCVDHLSHGVRDDG